MSVQQRKSENSDVTGNGYTNDLLPNLQGATSISEFAEVNTTLNKIGYLSKLMSIKKYPSKK